MINFLNATFIKSCPNRNEKPQAQKPEVLIVGRSNVGKSSLINALTQKKKLAFSVAITRSINEIEFIIDIVII